MKERLDINEHAYVILVPLSEEAQARMDQYDIYDNEEVAECFKSMVFGLETEEYMEIRLFDLINAKLDILINIYSILSGFPFCRYECYKRRISYHKYEEYALAFLLECYFMKIMLLVDIVKEI